MIFYYPCGCVSVKSYLIFYTFSGDQEKHLDGLKVKTHILFAL